MFLPMKCLKTLLLLSLSLALPAGAQLITDTNFTGSARNNFSGPVGAKFTVGGSPISVTNVAMWSVSGINHTYHYVAIVRVSDNALLAHAIVPVTASSGAWSGYATNVTLAASTAYYLVAYESNGDGDAWYDEFTPTGVGPGLTLNNSAYGGTLTTLTINTAGKLYVPVNFNVTLGGGVGLTGTFFVSTNGNDNLDGRTTNTSWRTMQKAATTVAAPSHVYVLPGLYAESVKWNAYDGTNIPNGIIFEAYGARVQDININRHYITLTNFVIGEGHTGGFINSPMVWFDTNSLGSGIYNCAVLSPAGQNQVAFQAQGTNNWVYGCEFTNYSRVQVWNIAGTSGEYLHNYTHDIDNAEGWIYLWGYSNHIAGNIVSNYNDSGAGGTHPDLFQSFNAPSWGHLIESNLCINGTCAMGSMQTCANIPDCTSKVGAWIFRNNLFVNIGNKMDIDFPFMRFENNTFYNCVNFATGTAHCFNFYDSVYGTGTNGFILNNIFVICGGTPSDVNNGWFGIDASILSTMTVSNNMVVGDNNAAKNGNALYGYGWINGGNPQFISAPTSRRVIDLTGFTYANNTTTIVGSNTLFATQLVPGDYITLAPINLSGESWAYTNIESLVTVVTDNTHLTVQTAIGQGTIQKLRRQQNHDPVPDLHINTNSPARDAGVITTASLDYDGVPRTIGPMYDIGALEWHNDLRLELLMNGWPGQANVPDISGWANDGDVFSTITNYPTLTNGPLATIVTNAAWMADFQYFAVTNIYGIDYLTNWTFACWAWYQTAYNQATIVDGEANSDNGDRPYSWRIGRRGGQQTFFHTYDAAGNSTNIVAFNDNSPGAGTLAWHFYAVTVTPTQVISYTDGIATQTNNYTAPFYKIYRPPHWMAFGTWVHEGTWIYGDDPYPNCCWLEGAFGRPQIFARALTPTEITTLKNGGNVGGGSTPDPLITAQPQDKSVFATQSALFTISASGATALSYQWKTNGVNAGTNGPALSLSNVPLAWNNMTITCAVTDTAGTANSTTAHLFVNADPVITSQPQNTTVTSPSTALFSVTASGQTSFSYQWYSNGVAISGATASSYTTPATTAAYNGRQYYVIVTDTAGSLQSSTVILTVNSSPPTITSQPQNQTNTVGGTATFSVTATSQAPPLQYQWAWVGTNVTGATQSSWTTTPQSAFGVTQVYVVVSDVNGSTQSSNVTFTVNAPPAVIFRVIGAATLGRFN